MRDTVPSGSTASLQLRNSRLHARGVIDIVFPERKLDRKGEQTPAHTSAFRLDRHAGQSLKSAGNSRSKEERTKYESCAEQHASDM